MKLLIVGQAPSRETEGKPPFTGKCGAFLAELMGTTQDEMLEANEFINVLSHWPGKGINGDKFPVTEATISAQKLLPTMRGRRVILLGANVARAFGAKNFRYFERYEIRNPAKISDTIVPFMVVVPHPSGRNRYWNKPEHRENAKKFFRYLTVKDP
jgi:uracil-DNA glycosylase